MEVLFAIGMLYGVSYAVVRGTEYAGRAVRRAYLERWQRFAAANDRSRSPVRASAAGVKTGAAVATAATAALLAGRGFAAGWRVGWPEGRQRAHDRWAHLATNPPSSGPPRTDATGATSRWAPGAEPTPPIDIATGTGAPALDGATPVPPASGFQPLTEAAAGGTGFAGRPAPDAVRGASDAPAAGGASTTPTRTTDSGGTAVAIDTTTGGEVLTMDQLLAELGTIINEAAADLEDAQADAQRATEDAQRVELMVASLRSMDLDEQTLTEVGALGDSAAARQAAADQRAAAAESRHAQASAARDGVQARHQVMAEAHAATPHAADKSFYVGG